MASPGNGEFDGEHANINPLKPNDPLVITVRRTVD
jgi:hypothetical protein